LSLSRNGKIHILDDSGRSITHYNVPYGAKIFVNDGDTVEKGRVLFEWDPYSSVILTEKGGRVKFVDLIENVTMREEVDEQTLQKQRMVIEARWK